MMVSRFPMLDLGLTINHDPAAGSHKVCYLSYSKIYKRKIIFKADGLFSSILNRLSKEANKMISKIGYPHEVIDLQVVFRPDLNSVGFKIAVRFESENDWKEYKYKQRTLTPLLER